MRTWNVILSALLILAATSFCAPPVLASETDELTITGERLDPATYGPGVVETIDDVLARAAYDTAVITPKGRRNGAQGTWVVPSRGATSFPHSGKHYVTNKWGDTRMGIEFPEPVDVHGAYFAGQGSSGAWTTGVRAIGYRDGEVVQETEWFYEIGAKPMWFPMDLRGVDRIVIESQPVVDGGGWYGMDDLTFSAHSTTPVPAADMTVLDFEDLQYRARLTGSDYAGLVWETGHGDFEAVREMPPPYSPPEWSDEGAEITEVEEGEEPPRAGTPPTLGLNFQGVKMGDVGANAIPPDTMGAIGPNHYVEVVNQNLSVYNRETGKRVHTTSLYSWFSSTSMIGDPRVVFDQHSGRWIVTATTFYDGARLYLAVSKGTDPIWGGWFKTYFLPAQGGDAGKWPDFPTLGVDENGIYTAMTMFGGANTMTLFAIDKAPLIANPPSLGTITAFRYLPQERAIQPAHTYGDPGGEYLVSQYNASALRIRMVNPPLTNPTLSHIGFVGISYSPDPPNAPALGGSPLDTGDSRLQLCFYRDGSLWTCHTTMYSAKAACRWYEIDPVGLSLIQSGTLYDSSLYFFYPSLCVNSRGDVVMGFTGSHSAQYAACYYTGRLASDPLGEMATPVLFKEGEGPYTIIDSYGRNRWGDYSYTTLDPNDDLTLWTIQEYAASPSNKWGTWVGVLSYESADQACCLPSGICQDETVEDCTSLGGVPQGAGTECATTECPACRADLNCDGFITFDDINPFVLRLSDPGQYANAFPDCPDANGDINNDGEVDFNDINPFVAVLSQQPPPDCPNP